MNVGSCPSASRAAASRKLNRLERLFYLGSVFVDRGRLRVVPTRRYADTPIRRYAAQGRSVRTSSFLLFTFYLSSPRSPFGRPGGSNSLEAVFLQDRSAGR